MGECGCTQFNAILKFKGPRGVTYVLDIYPSCSYCDAPLGIILYAFDKEACRDWAVDEVPEIDIDRDEGTCIPILHPEDMKKLMAKTFAGDEEMIDVCQDGVDDCFKDAVFEGIRKTVAMFSQKSQ